MNFNLNLVGRFLILGFIVSLASHVIVACRNANSHKRPATTTDSEGFIDNSNKIKKVFKEINSSVVPIVVIEKENIYFNNSNQIGAWKDSEELRQVQKRANIQFGYTSIYVNGFLPLRNGVVQRMHLRVADGHFSDKIYQYLLKMHRVNQLVMQLAKDNKKKNGEDNIFRSEHSGSDELLVVVFADTLFLPLYDVLFNADEAGYLKYKIVIPSDEGMTSLPIAFEKSHFPASLIKGRKLSATKYPGVSLIFSFVDTGLTVGVEGESEHIEDFANKIGESRRDGMTKGILTMDSSGKLFGKTRDCPHVATVSDSNRLNSSELDTLNQFLCSEKNRFSEIIADADVDIECGIVFKTLNLFFRTAACTDRIIITEGAPLCGK